MDDVSDLAALRRERVASDAEYIEQLEQLTLGLSATLADTETERDAWKATVTRMMEDEERLRDERDRLRAVVDGYTDDLSRIAFAVAGHRTGAVHHDDILGLVQSAVTERDRLRTVAFMLYRTLSDEPIEDLEWLTPEYRDLLAHVVNDLSPHLNPERAHTAMQDVVAERDRLRTIADDATIDATALVAERADLEDEVDRLQAVVDAARMVLTVIDSTTAGRILAGVEGGDEITLLRVRLDRLDASAEANDG